MKDTEKVNISQFILEQYVMVLGVNDDNQPLVSTVYYVTEDAKTLYFKSRTGSNHSQLINQNPKVAVAIYDHSSTYKVKKGIQALAVVERVITKNEIQKVVKLYSDAFEGAGEKLQDLEALISPNAVSAMYKCNIKELKCVDSGVADILLENYVEWE